MSTHYLLYSFVGINVLFAILLFVLVADNLAKKKKIKQLIALNISLEASGRIMADSWIEALTERCKAEREISDMILAIYGSRTIDRNCRDVARLLTELQKANHSLQERLDRAISLVPLGSGASQIRKENP